MTVVSTTDTSAEYPETIPVAGSRVNPSSKSLDVTAHVTLMSSPSWTKLVDEAGVLPIVMIV